MLVTGCRGTRGSCRWGGRRHGRALRADQGAMSDRAQAPSKATSTASRCSSGKCADAPGLTCSAAASCSPTNRQTQHGKSARTRIEPTSTAWQAGDGTLPHLAPPHACRAAEAFSLIRTQAETERSGSQTGSQRRQRPGDARPQSARIHAVRWLIERHGATYRDASTVPSKQRVAGSNPAGRTSLVSGSWADHAQTFPTFNATLAFLPK